MHRALTAMLFVALALPIAAHPQSSPASDKPFIVEYYYKTKWGHAEEFLKLFKKNHYPLLKKEVELGRMTKVWVDQPRYHTRTPPWPTKRSTRKLSRSNSGRIRTPTPAKSNAASKSWTHTGICR
jgi:hypothetical protein